MKEKDLFKNLFQKSSGKSLCNYRHLVIALFHSHFNRKKSDPLLQKEEAEKIKSLIESTELKISEITKKPVKIKPRAPFITSTLQQAASTKLSFNVKRTMRVAQKLYEAGHITYMRTDAPSLSKESIQDARNL